MLGMIDHTPYFNQCISRETKRVIDKAIFLNPERDDGFHKISAKNHMEFS